MKFPWCKKESKQVLGENALNEKNQNNIDTVYGKVFSNTENIGDSISKCAEGNIKEQLNNILFSDNIDIIKYLLVNLADIYGLELDINLDTASEYYKDLKITFKNANFILSNNEIYYKIISYLGKDVNITNQRLKLFNKLNFYISNYESNSFSIYMSKSETIKDNEIKKLKELLENVIFSSDVLDKTKDIFDLESNIKEFKNFTLLEDENSNYIIKANVDVSYDDLRILVYSISKKFGTYLKFSEGIFIGEELSIIFEENKNLLFRVKIFIMENGELKLSVSKPVNQLFYNKFLKHFLGAIDSLGKKIDKNFYVSKLKDLGVIVNLPEEKDLDFFKLLKEEGFVAYEDLSKQIYDDIVYPIKNRKEIEEKASKLSPVLVSSVVPNAVLFYGPPGTGKTTISKIIGKSTNFPFIYLPVQKIMSKWYGESESKFDRIFNYVGELAKLYSGCVFMIDEIDEIGKNRENAHEATARITSVLLKRLDGIEKIDNILLIGATNLKDSLDSALLSRFSESIKFDIPNKEQIRGIMKYYLPDLELIEDDLFLLEGMSARDLRKLSEKVIKKVIADGMDLNKAFKLLISSDYKK